MNITHKNYPRVKEYVKQWKLLIGLAKMYPDVLVKINWNMEKTAIETRQWFLQALNNRINFRGSIPFYKKEDVDWFYRYWRDQQAIQNWYNNHIIIHCFETKECKERFENLIWREE